MKHKGVELVLDYTILGGGERDGCFLVWSFFVYIVFQFFKK